MKRVLAKIAIAAAAVLVAVVTLVMLSENGAFDIDVVVRETPLAHPIEVTHVEDGTLTLADGRAVRPAGIRRSSHVDREEFDRALRVVAAQGVVVMRELGDGSAFLLAEPRFYNSCGTRGYQGSRWKRLDEVYVQCPISELLIQSGYAVPDLEQAGVSPHERWRVEGTAQFDRANELRTISETRAAFRFRGDELLLRDLDEVLQLTWKLPPS